MGKLFLQDFLCLLWALKPGSCSGYEYHQSNLLWASPIPGFNRWNSQIPSDFTNLTLCLCRVREWNSFWKRFLWCQSQCWDTPLQSSGTLSEALLNLFFLIQTPVGNNWQYWLTQNTEMICTWTAARLSLLHHFVFFYSYCRMPYKLVFSICTLDSLDYTHEFILFKPLSRLRLMVLSF